MPVRLTDDGTLHDVLQNLTVYYIFTFPAIHTSNASTNVFFFTKVALPARLSFLRALWEYLFRGLGSIGRANLAAEVTFAKTELIKSA